MCSHWCLFYEGVILSPVPFARHVRWPGTDERWSTMICAFKVATCLSNVVTARANQQQPIDWMWVAERLTVSSSKEYSSSDAFAWNSESIREWDFRRLLLPISRCLWFVGVTRTIVYFLRLWMMYWRVECDGRVSEDRCDCGEQEVEKVADGLTRWGWARVDHKQLERIGWWEML